MDDTTDVAELSDMDDDGVKSLFEALSQVPDYRHKRGRRYEAAIVLTLLILGKLAGERTVSGIAHWARLRQAWLTEVLGLTQVPCANTYHYVCEHLDVVELNAVVQQWFAAHRAGEMSDGLKHWALDGKMLRGSHRRTPTPVAGQEVLNVYDVDTGCLQHCAMIESKGYEAAAAQDYIGQTDCAGVVVTARASQAALAGNRPEGRWASPADLSSAMVCSTMACRRWSASTSTRSPGRSVTKAW